MQITTLTHHSEMGSWTHSECVPPGLASVVEKMWHFEGRMSLLRERSFPRVYSEIILQLGPRFRDVDRDGNTLDFFPQLCIGGATTAPSVIESPDAICCVIGIQLHATAAFQLLGFSPGKLHDLTISLDDAFGCETNELADQCYEAKTVAARFELIVRFVEQRLSRTPAAHAAVEWASRITRESNGQLNITSLQEKTALSKSRFVGLFREQTGFSPKHYARIVRFRNAMTLLQSGKRISETALCAGYYDQAHFQNEFSSFAEMTPINFLRAQRFPNSMSLPE